MPVPRLGFVVDFFATPLVGTRRGAQTTGAGGRFVPGVEEPLAFSGHAFRTSPAVLRRLDYGDEKGGQLTVRTTTPLRVADKETRTPGDIVEFEGERYEIDKDASTIAGASGSFSVGIYYGSLLTKATP